MSGSPNPREERPSFRERARTTLRKFWLEVKDSLWKELVKSTARVIILLAVILLGGYVILDLLEDRRERQQTMETYCFRGEVRDFYTGKLLAGVSVAIAEAPEGRGQTNPDGRFVICVDLPKDRETVEITLIHPGYQTEVYRKEAVPRNREAELFYKDYPLYPEERGRPEMLN